MIQKTWRGFSARREIKRRKCQLEEVLGLTMPSWTPLESLERQLATFDNRLDIQASAAQKMRDTIEKEKERVGRNNSLFTVEKMSLYKVISEYFGYNFH